MLYVQTKLKRTRMIQSQDCTQGCVLSHKTCNFHIETAKAIISWTSPFVHYKVGLSRYFEQPHVGFIAIKFSIGS